MSGTWRTAADIVVAAMLREMATADRITSDMVREYRDVPSDEFITQREPTGTTTFTFVVTNPKGLASQA